MSHFITIYLMTLVFVIGYALIAVEHYTRVNKATVAILMAVICWVIQYSELGISHLENLTHLCENISSISQVIFFLLGALAVVETINVHNGFKLISDFISVSSKKQLIWVIGAFSFVLSSVLDNLTTTIVMVSILQKIIQDQEDRWIIGSGVVIAANAGGAWTPIGDVTTTMLWIDGQVSTFGIMKGLALESIVVAVVSLFSLSFFLKGAFTPITYKDSKEEPYSTLILILGVLSLIFVPIFKTVTGLPPFMGILFGLGILWLTTDLLHSRYEDRKHLLMGAVFSKIDLAGVLFFLGILLSVASLETAGILKNLSIVFDEYIGNLNVIAIVIGIASAIIDNVPLVAATISMYDLAEIPQDHSFWILTALTAGTGGSMLIIGSAAGVVFMGLEKVDFLWYLKKASLPAALGYVAGVLVYLVR